MEMATINTRNHAAFRLHYHLVLSMKYRHKCLTAEILSDMEAIISGVLLAWNGKLVEFGGEADHVHLLFEAPPTARLSDLVKNIKSVTARKLRKGHAEHLSQFYWKPCFWNRAYAIISVGGRANIEQLLDYIKNQDDPRHLRP